MFRSTFCLLLSVCTVLGVQTNSAYLDVQEKFYIEWQYTDTNITILARVKTTGWFGIGFSPNGGMAGADIITAYVENGVAYLQDRYGERNGYPAVDDSQDVQLLSGSEVDGVTTVRFTRKHNTCDDKDTVVGTDTMKVIYAISPDGSDQLSYHTPYNRGARSVYLRKALALEQPMPVDATTFDVTVDKAVIPEYHTRYFCQLVRAPKLVTKHHVIKVETIIQKENLGLVHHMLLYGCYDSINREQYFEQNNTAHDCYNNNMPSDIDRCRAPINAWAIGGSITYFPDEAGFPLGGDKSPDYFMIEIHYDNPQLLTGKTDSSGMRLTMTKTLRQHDAAVFSAGGIVGLTIPPQSKDFTTSVFCTGFCSKKLMKEDVTVFGVNLHGHIATRQVIARQFRDGKELRTLDEDRHYDFNYQQYSMLENPIIIKPGDDIMVQCHYNTEGRTKMTYGDLPTTSEMCLTYVFYYPAQEISECLSAPGWGAWDPSLTHRYLKNAMGYTKPIDRDARVTLNKMSAEGFWTDAKRKKLQDDHFTFPQLHVCTDRARNYQRARANYIAPKASQKDPAPRPYEMECAKQANSVVG